MTGIDRDLNARGSAMTRTLGQSGIEVSALGLGCWAIGGVWNFQGAPGGWSRVDDTDRSVDSYPGQDTYGDIVTYLNDDVRASLRPLGTDRVDVYQLHVGDLRLDRALEVLDTLADFDTQGLIRTYGWSTDDVAAAREFSNRPGCSVVQHGLSVLGFEDPAMLALAGRPTWPASTAAHSAWTCSAES